MYAFDDIIGNFQIIKNLKTSISSGKISHAYIINGDEGSGKMMLAKTFAKTVLCEAKGQNPCGVCSSCTSFETGNNPDVFYVSTDKKNLGVKDVRNQIVDIIDVKPYKYSKKIFIIDNADKMTIEAQNALLKTLEEPPEYALFMLLAENVETFLQTILSRCVMLKLRSLTSEQVKNYLVTKEKIDEDKAGLFVEYSQGSIGKGIKIAKSEDFTAMRKDILNKLISIKNINIADVMLMAEELKVYKDNREFLDIAYMWYRDILAYMKTNDKNIIIQKDIYLNIIEESKKISAKGVIKNLEAIWNAKKQLGQNASFQLTLEVMLLKIKNSYDLKMA